MFGNTTLSSGTRVRKLASISRRNGGLGEDAKPTIQKRRKSPWPYYWSAWKHHERDILRYPRRMGPRIFPGFPSSDTTLIGGNPYL